MVCLAVKSAAGILQGWRHRAVIAVPKRSDISLIGDSGVLRIDGYPLSLRQSAGPRGVHTLIGGMKIISSVRVLATLVFVGCLGLAGQTPSFYNTTEISGPFQTSSGAPDYVKITNFTVRQIGQYVQFKLEAAASPRENTTQYYFVVLDTDFNSNTGQRWGPVGAEIKIGVRVNEARWHTFNPQGELVGDVKDVKLTYQGNAMYLYVRRAEIPVDRFKVYFDSSGDTPYTCRGAEHSVTLQPPGPEISIVCEPEQGWLTSRPALINLPVKNAPVKLHTYLVQGDSRTRLPDNEVSYSVWHPVRDPRLGAPSTIVSIDSSGEARYLREGYVFAMASAPVFGLFTEPFILATGDVYGDPQKDEVIAVFPSAYRPEGRKFSLGDILTAHPNYIATGNLAYRVMAGLYGGFKPYGGETQILALLELAGHAGGNNNPLETSSVGYMDIYGGTPNYELLIHEMGHNFASTAGMASLTRAESSKLGASGFGEGVASLPVIYLASEFALRPEQYGFSTASYESRHYRSFLQRDKEYSQGVLKKFESLLSSGATKGIFDNGGKFDGVGTFCSMFQSYAYGFTPDENRYGNEMIRRFLALFGDIELPDFDPSKVETYFSAAFCAAVDVDVRPKLRSWGFTIDDAYFLRIHPAMQARLRITPSYVGAERVYYQSGQAIGFTPEFGGSPYQFSASGLPSGLTINAFTGTIAGSVIESGVVNITVHAQGIGGRTSQNIQLNVAPSALAATRMINISLRSHTEPGDNTATAGFAIDGPKKVLARLIGPTLKAYGINETLERPVLQLYRGPTLIESAGAWRSSPERLALSSASNSVGAFAISPTSEDVVAVWDLDRGVYTLQSTGIGGTSGAGLIELYDLDRGAAGYVNLSARAFVGSTDDKLLISGFVVGGVRPRRFLVRGVGPALIPFGVSTALLDPQITIYDGARNAVSSNDDWGGAQSISDAGNSVGAFGLSPGSKDSALIVTLNPGLYSVVVRGAANSTGVALAEIYALPD